jgi:hypothetical protein
MLSREVFYCSFTSMNPATCKRACLPSASRVTGRWRSLRTLRQNGTASSARNCCNRYFNTKYYMLSRSAHVKKAGDLGLIYQLQCCMQQLQLQHTRQKSCRSARNDD